MRTTGSKQRERSTLEILGIIWKTQRKFLIGAIIFTICMLALLYGFSKFREYRISNRPKTPRSSELQKENNTLRQNAHIFRSLCHKENVEINSTIN